MAHQWLCETCRKIPFDSNLNKLRSSKYRGPRDWYLGSFGDVRRRDCHFCRLIALTCAQRQLTSWHPLTPANDDSDVSVTFYEVSTTFSANLATIGTNLHVVSNTSGHANPVARERLTDWIDFDEVKCWINQCVNDHHNPVSDCIPMPFNAAVLPRIDRGQLDFRLVDANAMCIVCAPRRARYVALSYVWGRVQQSRLILTSRNEAALSQPNALATGKLQLPNTIRDALTVVRKLGWRYLWVDSLCLMQDDPSELEACVAVMDLFYEMADFTIIAGGGQDAFAGLEGVPPTKRRQGNHTVLDIVPGLRMTAVQDVDRVLSRLAYNRRAWTMQEELLSHRALIFAAGQVYWKCRERYIDERLSAKTQSETMGSRRAVGSLYYTLLKEEYTDFCDFSATIMYYMNKQLSFEGDVLRAAKGMLRRFSELSGIHCFEGLPSPLGQSLLFYALGFPVSRASGRRQGFPSYSWTGWKSSPQYDEEVETGPLRHWINWHCKFKDGLTYRIGETGRLRKAPLPRAKDALEAAPRELQQITATASDNVNYSIHPDTYPLLMFWTVVVHLRLVAISESNLPEWPTGHTNYEPMDRFGHRIGGLVNMDIASSTEDWLVGKFALLASSTTGFWALLLEWRNEIAERRGVVALYKSVLDKCLKPGPRWRAIVLR